MKASHKVLKEAIQKVGVKALSLKLGLSRSMIYKWCEDPKEKDWRTPSGAANPLDRLQRIYEETQDDQMIRWLAEMADGTFVRNAIIDIKKPDAKIFANMQKFIKEFSETLDAISNSYQDKSISEKEAKNIRKEWEDLKSIGEGFVRACEDGRFKK